MALDTRLHASALTSKLIINDGFYFVEYENLKNPINVKIGDGRILKGTEVGQTLTYFVLNKMRIKINMSNVLFIIYYYYYLFYYLLYLYLYLLYLLFIIFIIYYIYYLLYYYLFLYYCLVRAFRLWTNFRFCIFCIREET